MGEERTFALRFKSVPKIFKKYIKDNYQTQKYYDPKEANVIYADAVSNTGVTGSMIVVLKCLASNKVICDAEIEIDPTLALDVTLMNTIERDMREQGRPRSEIDTLLDDFKCAFCWHEQQEVKQMLDKATAKLKDGELESVEKAHEDEVVPVKSTIKPKVEQTYEDEIVLGINDERNLELFDPIAIFDSGEDNIFEDDFDIDAEDTNDDDDLLDVSNIKCVFELEQILQIEKSKLENPLEYLLEVFDLTGSLDFVATKKKDFVEANYTQKATNFFGDLCSVYNSGLQGIKKQAELELSKIYREVQSENYKEVETQVDAVKKNLQRKFDEIKEAEIAKEIVKIEKKIKEELDLELALRQSNIEKELLSNLTDEQKEQLITYRASVENIIKSDVEKLMNESDAKNQKFIDDIRLKLQIKQFDFEREYNNLEMQRMRQEMLEEQKQFQQQMLEMQQNQQNQNNVVDTAIDLKNNDQDKKSNSTFMFIFVILALIGGVVFLFSLGFAQEMILDFLQ